MATNETISQKIGEFVLRGSKLVISHLAFASNVRPMTEKYQAANDYSDSEILAILREALLKIMVSGQMYQLNIGGGTRMLTRANVAEVQGLIREYELRVDAENGVSAANYARMTRN